MRSYRLGDTPTEADLKKVSQSSKRSIRAIATEAFREPRKGEWYLSGAVVAAYRAPNDLLSRYRIARLVPVRI